MQDPYENGEEVMAAAAMAAIILTVGFAVFGVVELVRGLMT